MLPLFSEYASLDKARAAAMRCVRRPLSATRNQVVFGAGDADARIMLIGQGPSLTDDSTSLPYIGSTAVQVWRDLVADLRLARERAISM